MLIFLCLYIMYYVYSIFNVLQSSIMAYLVAQTVKNLLAMQEMQEIWIWSLGQEDLLK